MGSQSKRLDEVLQLSEAYLTGAKLEGLGKRSLPCPFSENGKKCPNFWKKSWLWSSMD